uniref:centromere protein T isoform X2 n=1 Tax=Scatophagus argus TaxID=75038 RepID=UPI001ED8057B|nr:centromere protein T isoform X2 [Scatophagus argus]
MDPTEDLSARVLLKHILNTEPPRTPITRSASKTHSSNASRRSSRLGNKDAGAQTPQDILRRSLKHKIRESITRKSLPATKRRTASFVKKTNTPAPTSMLFDDGETPRHILMNILRTEPVRSPVVHSKADSEEPQPSSANSSITSKRQSTELSGLDLPDITIGTAVSTAKGLSRKRPRRSLNVTAFENRLKDDDDVEEENEVSIGNHSSVLSSSSTSLSLKTPFVDLRTEKRGLQRRVSNRRKITEEEFGAAVNKRQMGEATSIVEQGPSETAYSEGFTLGLSKLGEPDVTSDIILCNTALYAQSDAMTSTFSIVATQDKPTVMASQLQRQMIEAEQEELMEAEENSSEKERSLNLFLTEEGTDAEAQCEEGFSPSQSEDVNVAESEKEEGKSTAGGQTEDAVAMLISEEEQEEGIAELQTSGRDDTSKSEEENRVQAQTEEDVTADSQNKEEDGEEDEEAVGVESQSEEDVTARSQSEEEEVAPDSQTEREEGAVDSQDEELAVNSHSEEEEDFAEHQSNQENPSEGCLADSQAEDEHDEEEDGEKASKHLERDLEHISRRAHRSEGGIIPVTEAHGDWADTTEGGLSDGKLKSKRISELAETSIQGQIAASHTEAEPDTDKENSFRLSIEDSEHLSNDSPEEDAAQDPAEEEEGCEDEEDDEDSEDVPSKTPAFVREKRTFFQPDPLASPSVLKNVQASTSESLPAPKPKPMRKRTKPAQREGGLPKTYLMKMFKHFAKTKVSADVYPVLKETMDKFFERLAEDLETYAVHAKRKTIEFEDAELLLKRQGYVNDKVPVEVLIEKYLRMDQRKLLIPIATSGNVVVPKKRR